MVAQNLIALIGNTPLVELSQIEKHLSLPARIVAKIEAFNPGGSVKDRAALSMIEDAEKKGILQPSATIIEPTSGNTGIGLAWVGAVKGYHVILTMPETMSIERRNLLQAYGAELVLTPGSGGMKGAIAEAERLRDSIPGSVILGQFDNPANPEAHYLSTGEEIWNATEGEVDIFVAGVGTGGTVSGVMRRLKQHNPEIKGIAVEPAESPVLSGGKPGPHKIQGIGAGFVPKNYDSDVVDEVVRIDFEKAAEAMRLLARKEGILAGISSGAALAAAVEEARRPENEGKLIVVLFPDTGDRYLSSGVFND